MPRIGWLPLCTSGDIALPCLLCLSEKQGRDVSTVTFSAAQLRTDLTPRLRQHLRRKHHIGIKHRSAEAICKRARILVCQRIHSQLQDLQDLDQSDISIGEVMYRLYYIICG